MSKYKIKDITDISKINRNKVRITLLNFANANKIVKICGIKDLETYKFTIPLNYVHTEGIIKGVPTYLQIEDLPQHIQSDIPIQKIERLTYWNKDQQLALPSNSLKITFRSFKIPTSIKVHYINHQVSLFVQRPLLCNTCLSYGHTKKWCKKEETLCRICAKNSHEGNCTPTCKHCPPPNNTHTTAHATCETYKYQQQVKTIMTHKKITYNEAKINLKNFNPTPAAADINNYKRTYAQILQESNGNSTIQQTSNITNNNKQTTSNQANTAETTSPKSNEKAENFIKQVLQIVDTCKNEEKTPGKIDYAIIHLMAATEKYLQKTNIEIRNTQSNEQ